MARKAMPRKMLTKLLVRNSALVVLEPVLLSCDMEIFVRWSSGILSMVSGCYPGGRKLAYDRVCNGSSRQSGGLWSCC